MSLSVRERGASPALSCQQVFSSQFSAESMPDIIRAGVSQNIDESFSTFKTEHSTKKRQRNEQSSNAGWCRGIIMAADCLNCFQLQTQAENKEGSRVITPRGKYINVTLLSTSSLICDYLCATCSCRKPDALSCKKKHWALVNKPYFELLRHRRTSHLIMIACDQASVLND